MSNLKKAIAVLLAAAMVFALAACGASPAAPAPAAGRVGPPFADCRRRDLLRERQARGPVRRGEDIGVGQPLCIVDRKRRHDSILLLHTTQLIYFTLFLSPRQPGMPFFRPLVARRLPSCYNNKISTVCYPHEPTRSQGDL